MAIAETPKSDATRRAERKADRARADLLNRQWQDEKRARNELKWGAERKVHEKKMREIEAELRELGKKKYD